MESDRAPALCSDQSKLAGPAASLCSNDDQLHENHDYIDRIAPHLPASATLTE